MKKNTLLTIIAEWLEEWEMPALILRNQPAMDLEGLKRIFAIAGPRRAGKTYYMYQLIQSLLQSGRYNKEHILFLDFEDYRLGDFSGDAMDEIFTAFHQLVGRYPLFLFKNIFTAVTFLILLHRLKPLHAEIYWPPLTIL